MQRQGQGRSEGVSGPDRDVRVLAPGTRQDTLAACWSQQVRMSPHPPTHTNARMQRQEEAERRLGTRWNLLVAHGLNFLVSILLLLVQHLVGLPIGSFLLALHRLHADIFLLQQAPSAAVFPVLQQIEQMQGTRIDEMGFTSAQ